MGYGKHDPSVYVVGWPHLSAIKVGYTDCRRFRMWQLRGATIYTVDYFSHFLDAYAAEEAVHEYMRTNYDLRFESRDEQYEAIQVKDGYCEMYRVHDFSPALRLIGQVIEEARKNRCPEHEIRCSGQCSEQCTYVRTDGLTNDMAEAEGKPRA